MPHSVFSPFIRLFFSSTRRTFTWVALVLIGMLVFGMYLQEVVGLHPCPMCVVQRYCFALIACIAVAGAICKRKAMHVIVWIVTFSLALIGSFVAARQSWLQWYPPEFISCGRGDIYSMIEQMSLSRAIPKIFSGTGDCSAVEWAFLGGTIANWSFVGFVAVALVAVSWFIALLKQD